jgi:prolyl 4-hydroxylase
MSAFPVLLDRLPFALPDFTRRSWTSDTARSSWEPRLERICRAWAEVEWMSVVDDVRACALVALSQEALSAAISAWSAKNLSAVGIPVSSEGHAGLTFAAVGKLEDVTRLREAWTARSDDEIGCLLGYPPCCRSFFRDVWVEQRCLDTTWAMASNTTPAEASVVTLESTAAPLANILWRWLGVRAVPHLPCRFDCHEATVFAEQLLRVADRAGYSEEVAWLKEVLSWPVEWSALHGIAEVKTPVLKFSTRTDATANKYVVRWKGTGYPKEGATGLRFPYQASTRRPMTEGRSFQLGLKRSIETPVSSQAWYHGDNGFSSREVMHEFHRPLVDLARRKLKGRTGDVLDLGCGNGALLAKISDGEDGLTPHGVDKNMEALAHAAVLVPKFAPNFKAGDLFDCDTWDKGPRYALALLMAGRLLEVDRLVADRMMARLLERSDAILLYVYPGSEVHSLTSITEKMGLRLEDGANESVGLLLRSPPSSSADAIDWSRLAEPQLDEYDTDVALRLASSTTSGARLRPYRRTEVGASPSAFDGHVAIRHVYQSVPEFAPFVAHYFDAPADHPNIQLAADHIRNWPAAFTQCQRLLEAIHPALDGRIPFESDEIYRGSSCHSLESLFGTMWATIHCPIGTAEAIVHEMAHQKLRALGVSFESATTIVGNDPLKLYVSPIIKDRQRPMTAVLHAQYSYVHVAALDLRMLEAERDPTRRRAFGVLLARNLSRIEEGRETIRRHFEPGPHGPEFMDGFSRWTDAIIESGRELLRREKLADSTATTTAIATAGAPTGENGQAATVTPRPLPAIDTHSTIVMTPDRAVEVLSTFAAPHVVLLGNVLSDEECDILVEYCNPRLTPSSVLADADGNVRPHENRTSRDAMLRRGETETVARIEARLAALARWPVGCGEGFQVVRYDSTQEYRAHCDWLDPEVPGLRKHMETGGQRLATFILYLTEVDSGGETSFPAIGLRIMPRKGGAVFFLNTDAQYVPDRLTLHAGSPVVSGVKFVANKWLRQRPF